VGICEEPLGAGDGCVSLRTLVSSELLLVEFCRSISGIDETALPEIVSLSALGVTFAFLFEELCFVFPISSLPINDFLHRGWVRQVSMVRT
jgi:hypothetical protein